MRQKCTNLWVPWLQVSWEGTWPCRKLLQWTGSFALDKEGAFRVNTFCCCQEHDELKFSIRYQCQWHIVYYVQQCIKLKFLAPFLLLFHFVKNLHLMYVLCVLVMSDTSISSLQNLCEFATIFRSILPTYQKIRKHQGKKISQNYPRHK